MTEASPSSVALWGFNGTMPESGTELHKEFNPENPPLGSTVIATFVWLGSSNIIDSVTDFLWTGQQVGNTYHLVEYVTADGISMASYVATNVQNFPSPKQVLGEELVVEAHLSTSVSGGGALVSAYTGVNPEFAQAVGAHRSASGSGSTQPTIADPGAITVGAGALAYAISMTSEGSAGRGAPTGFTYITNAQSESPPFQFDAEYAVPSSAGSVDPAWRWSFTSPNTWLATVLALNPATASSNQPPVAAFTPSCSALTCNFTNTSSDPDGSISAYSWAFGDSYTSTDQNPGHTYAAAGTYTVTLTVTDNQGATGTTSLTVTLAAANQPPVANFVFNCAGLTCSFTSTSSDPDGTIASYQWTFGDGASSTAQNPSHTYPAGGAYTVTLTVTDNVGATNAISKTATIGQPPVATHLVFTVQPSATTAGGTISPAVQVTAKDDAGNTDASFSGSITVALAMNPGGGTLSGTKTVTATNGVAAFSTLSIDKAGNGYTLGATTTAGLTGATSAAFNVNAAPPAGVALDQWNGSFNETGRMLIKGFNPTNPHLGDAIVATFFWVGSTTTNIIDSVTDVLTTSPYTPVGNTYHLVEYVTAGGISMATYVATNVQNFPDPNLDQSTVLAVRASLSDSVTDGGIMMFAYTGVAAVYAQALNGHRSGVGSGSSYPTVADPGAIAVNGGGLAYAVTMASPPAGADRPPSPPWTDVVTVSGNRMIGDAEYMVPASTGSVDPHWNWYFSSLSTWLATALALNPAP